MSACFCSTNLASKFVHVLYVKNLNAYQHNEFSSLSFEPNGNSPPSLALIEANMMESPARVWLAGVDSHQQSWHRHNVQTPNNEVGAGMDESRPGSVAKSNAEE